MPVPIGSASTETKRPPRSIPARANTSTTHSTPGFADGSLRRGPVATTSSASPVDGSADAGAVSSGRLQQCDELVVARQRQHLGLKALGAVAIAALAQHLTHRASNRVG